MTFNAAKSGMVVVANDLFHFSGISARGRASTSHEALGRAQARTPAFNALLERDDHFAKAFTESAGRFSFNIENALHIATMRAAIYDTSQDKQNSLLAGLLKAVSRMSNTAGVQAPHLKTPKVRARAAGLRSELPIAAALSVEGTQGNSLDAVDRGGWDVVSVDSPYHQRPYAPTHHLYETLMRDDTLGAPDKTGIRDRTSKSDRAFYHAHDAGDPFAEIARRMRTTKGLALSYNSDGPLPIGQIQEIFATEAPEQPTTLHDKPSSRYNSNSNHIYWENAFHEYLFVSIAP